MAAWVKPTDIWIYFSGLYLMYFCRLQVYWFQLYVVPLHLHYLHCALHCELRRVKCIRINYRSEIFQMEFEVQGLCYNHHARRKTALLKYLLGIRILWYFLLSMPKICPFPQICRESWKDFFFHFFIFQNSSFTYSNLTNNCVGGIFLRN